MGRRSSRDCACRSVAALVLPLRRPTRRRYYPTTSPATIAHRRGLSWSSLGWFTLKPSGTTFLIRAVSPLLSFLLSSFSSPLPAHFFHSIFLSFFSFSLLWFVISSILVFYSSAQSYPFLSFAVLSSSSLSSFRLKFPGPSILFVFLFMSPLLSPTSPYSPLSSCVYLYLLFSFSFPPDVVSFLSFSSDPSSPHSVSLLRYNSTPTSLVQELVFPYTPLFLAVPLSVRGCV